MALFSKMENGMRGILQSLFRRFNIAKFFFLYTNVSSFEEKKALFRGRNMKKEIKWAFGLSAAILLGGSLAVVATTPVSVSASAVASVSTWDGTTRTAPSKTVTMGGKSFYCIETAAQLASLAGSSSNSNNYILLNDIDLDSKDWTPIASIEFDAIDHCQFNGIFDGNGHTIKNFKLPGTESAHHDYKWASAVSSSANYASSIGFFGRVGSSGIIKNLNLIGSATHAGVGTTAHYWYNGGLVGHNFGLIRNVSLDGVGFRSDAFYESGIAGWSSIVKDSGIGILCGRNEGKMDYTATKNCYLYCYETGGKTTWNGSLYIANFRYGQNCGYNNRVSGWEYANNYYYNNTTSWASGGYGVNPEVDSRSIAVNSANGFDTSKFPGGDALATSSLTDNFDPLDTSGTVNQDQTSVSLDYAARLLSYDCASCTNDFLQKCLNDYNLSDTAKRVYSNLSASQSDNGTSAVLSAEYKLKYLAAKKGLSLQGATPSASILLSQDNEKNGVIALSVLALSAALASASYILLKRKDA
jgi:hypothetical protein